MNAEQRTLPRSRIPENRWHPLNAVFRMLGLEDKVAIAIHEEKLNVSMQDGKPVLVIHSPNKMLTRLLLRGDLGFAESYMAGEWSTDNLTGLLATVGANDRQSSIRKGFSLERLRERLLHAFRHNSKTGSRKNIAYHYDLSNDFYSLWLDNSMTYSSAIFSQPDQTLSQAQKEKYLRLLDSLEARRGDHILEIGCGWGGFAEVAAQRGLKVTGITLSREQLAYARKRIRRAGLKQLVNFEFRDYRDLEGTYDHVVSIEMFEAVGEQYWSGYFEKIRSCLRPGGHAALQIITIDKSAFETYRNKADFIQKYIFPGGMLPSVEHLEELAESASMKMDSLSRYGRDYARTLRAWHRSFDEKAQQISELDFDRRFRKMWKYYLSYCEAGFLLGRIDLVQLRLTR